ncbi:MAG: helix-turn-helix domain-containing protein [Eubacteriales bacterium]|nr:helix-turn-helix domain-containing protein [Eubacteriales bacterium]
MDNYLKILANNIAKHRKAKNLTQETLAARLGISFQAISKWENEQSCPDILLLPQLSEIFGVSIDELFGKEVHHDNVIDLPWLDDNTIRGVVFSGHKILDNCDDMSTFTFKLEGQPLNVISYCNIECKGDIKGSAKAECGINCGNINGDVDAGCGVNCGNIEQSVNAGCGVNCGNVGGSIVAGLGVNCGNVFGSIEGQDVNCGDVKGSVECQNIECKKVVGDVNYIGNITYK